MGTVRSWRSRGSRRSSTPRLADAPAAEAYWVGVTGWPLSERRGDDGEFATLQPPDGDAPVKVQVAGSPPPNGMHLDVHTDDLECLVDDAKRLGAELRDTGGGMPSAGRRAGWSSASSPTDPPNARGPSPGRAGRAWWTRSVSTSRLGR